MQPILLSNIDSDLQQGVKCKMSHAVHNLVTTLQFPPVKLIYIILYRYFLSKYQPQKSSIGNSVNK